MERFVLGRSDVSVTIFVPWDCKFHCPFCTSKQMYSVLNEDTIEERMSTIISLIKRFNKTPISNFVITGGEPLNDIPKLKRLINAISEEKNIYINTSLPNKGHIEAINYLNSEKKITSISISRHKANSWDESNLLSSDSVLGTIRKDLPIRLNCVITDPKNFPIIKYINRFKNVELPKKSVINFRADYTKILNLEDLKSFNDPFVIRLSEEGCNYKGSNGCNVCNNDFFEKDGMRIAYHRGFQFTRQNLGNTTIVNDIIIFPNASWGYDWDRYDINKENLLKNLYINNIKKIPNKENNKIENKFSNTSFNDMLEMATLFTQFIGTSDFRDVVSLRKNKSNVKTNNSSPTPTINRNTEDDKNYEYKWVEPDTVCGFPERVKVKKNPKKVRVIYPACGSPYEEEIYEDDSGWGNSCGGGFGTHC